MKRQTISIAAPHMLVAFLILATIFTISAPQQRFEAEDALDYAAAVEFGETSDLISRNHLAYLPVSKLIFEGAKRLSVVDRALPLMVTVGALTAAGACVLFVVFLRHALNVEVRLAIFGGAALAASYGFWRYAGEAEVYAMASLSALGLLIAAYRLNPSTVGAATLAVLAVAAILGHSLNASIVIATPYLLLKRGWPIRHIVAAAVLGLALLMPILFGVYRYSVDDALGRAEDPGFAGFYLGKGTRFDLRPLDIVLAVGVAGSLIIASNAVFLYEPARDLITELIPTRALSEELYMGATAPEWLGWIAPVSMAVAVVSLVALVRRLDPASAIRSTDGKVLVIWMTVYSFIVIVGGNLTQPEVWLLLLIPFWGLIVISLRMRSVSSGLLLLVAGSLALNSLLSGLLPLYTSSDRQSDLTIWLESNADQSDLVLTADSAGLARYIAYQLPPQVAFIGGRVGAVDEVETLWDMIIDRATTREIISYLDDRRLLSGHRRPPASDGNLYVTRDFFDPPSWLEAANPEVAQMLAEMSQQYSQVFQPVDGSDLYFVRLTTP